LPHPRREARRATRQPPLYGRRARGARGRARPHPRDDAYEPSGLLRRAVRLRRPRAGARDGPLRRDRKRRPARHLARYLSSWESAIVFAKKRIPITTVRRVRLRPTMCVPPCDAGVKPLPPKPVSRPECSRISTTRAIERMTWTTAST